MEKKSNIFTLFLTMFKIGLFTFGGGYAMIAIIEREVVEKRNWISHEEFLDIIAIAESTPGPIAINSATYIGYKIKGVLGSILATLGVVLPSFIIILAISLFLDAFLKIEYVAYAFKGIQAGVSFLIISAGLRMLKKIKISAFNLIIFIITLILMIVLTLISKNFSSVFYIIFGGIIGVAQYLLSLMKRKKDKGGEKND